MDTVARGMDRTARTALLASGLAAGLTSGLLVQAVSGPGAFLGLCWILALTAGWSELWSP